MHDGEIQRLYENFGPMVLRRCRKILRHETEAVDALQDTFVQLLVNKDRMALQAPGGLLYRIATNICLNRIRARKRNMATLDSDPETALVERIAAVDDTERGVWMSRVLDRLFGRTTASTQLIACLHFVDGLTLEEVARHVGMSTSGVRKRLRALRQDLLKIEGGLHD